MGSVLVACIPVFHPSSPAQAEPPPSSTTCTTLKPNSVPNSANGELIFNERDSARERNGVVGKNPSLRAMQEEVEGGFHGDAISMEPLDSPAALTLAVPKRAPAFQGQQLGIHNDAMHFE